MFVKVRFATDACPDDRHEFNAMNFDGDSAERKHPRLAQFAATRLALQSRVEQHTAGVLLMPGNQVESSARAWWFGTQLPLRWKATESEGCQFMPDG